MTDVTEAAEAAISMLEEKGWSKGAAVGPGGSVCMAVALCDGKQLPDSMDMFRVFTDRNWSAMSCILRLFPERLPLGKRIADFNDHPDTTREDVLLVLKHMAEGE